MPLHRSYDDAKADPGEWSGSGPVDTEKHTRKLWFEAYAYAERQGILAEWLEAQRRIGKFAQFVAEVDKRRIGRDAA